MLGCWDVCCRLTHPDAQLHVLPTVDFHAFVQQADLLKVLPVHHEAANQSRAPEAQREGRKGQIALTQTVSTSNWESRPCGCVLSLKCLKLPENKPQQHIILTNSCLNDSVV